MHIVASRNTFNDTEQRQTTLDFHGGNLKFSVRCVKNFKLGKVYFFTELGVYPLKRKDFLQMGNSSWLGGNLQV